MKYTGTRTCPSCGAQNRIPVRHLADTGRCGTCKVALPPSPVPFEVNSAEFQEIVRDSRVPVFVDFWAPWCGPCRMAAPEVEALAGRMAGRLVVLKLNTEDHPDISERYRIQSIPTFMVFQNGRPVLQRSGVVPRAQMEGWVEQLMAQPAS